MTAADATVVAETPTDDGAAARDASPARRSTDLRLARLHLRMGSLSLARAELETHAGRGDLDQDALLDLAEVRWRTGDLAGAGDAANALLERGREEALALVIAAEAVAALGRPGEARRLAGRALEASDRTLDAWFAGMPRSLIWPTDGEHAEDLRDASRPAATPDRAALPAAERASRRDAQARAAGAGGAAAFAAGRTALAEGRRQEAALRFGIALRLEPAFAPTVLEALADADAEADGSAGEAALSLVAGDALRLLGREPEALAAFERAARSR